MEAGGGNDYDVEHGDAGEGAAAAGAEAAGRFPFFRSRTICTAAIFILCASSSILLGAVPDLSISVAHMLLCFFFLIAGVAMFTLSVVAAPRFPLAARAAAIQESSLMTFI